MPTESRPFEHDAQAPDHGRLKALAKELGRPLATLYAMSHATDPFMAGLPARRAEAQWFATLWRDWTLSPARTCGAFTTAW
jgi:hypothetical protein